MSTEMHVEHHEEQREEEHEPAHEIERDFGALEERVSNAVNDLGDHTMRLTNLEGDLTWIKTRINEIGEAISRIPSPEERAEMERRLNEVTERIASMPENLTQSLTELPAHEERTPKKSERRGGLRESLHRLL